MKSWLVHIFTFVVIGFGKGSYVGGNNSLTVEVLLDIHLEVGSWDFHRNPIAVRVVAVSMRSLVAGLGTN